MSKLTGRLQQTGQIVGRSVLIGGAVGGVVGGIIGTLLFPIVVTAVGAVIGGVVGLALGFVNGLMLSLLRCFTQSRAAAPGIAALTTGGAIALLTRSDHSPGWNVIIGSVFVILATVVAPLAADGAEPVDLGPRMKRRPFSQVVGVGVAIGAAIGGGVGMVAGAIIGGQAYLPTMPVAVVEGGLFGAGTGIVVALITVGCIMASRLELRHSRGNRRA
jgi:hypothetical protein